MFEICGLLFGIVVAFGSKCCRRQIQTGKYWDIEKGEDEN